VFLLPINFGSKGNKERKHKMYTNQINVERYLNRKLDIDESGNFELIAKGVDKYIDAMTRRTFGIDETDSVRYYSGGLKEIFIDDFNEITSVEVVDSSEIVTSIYDEDNHYLAFPRGMTPTSSIYKVSGRFPRGTNNIKVTGKLGVPVPDDIVLAATILVASVYSNPDNIKSESIEGYSKTFDTATNENHLILSAIDNNRRWTL
jgi:hypothetical protein